MNQILDKLEQIHGSVSVVGSMNADYTVTTERLPGPGETVTGGPLQGLPVANRAIRPPLPPSSAPPCACSVQWAPTRMRISC